MDYNNRYGKSKKVIRKRERASPKLKQSSLCFLTTVAVENFFTNVPLTALTTRTFWKDRPIMAVVRVYEDIAATGRCRMTTMRPVHASLRVRQLPAEHNVATLPPRSPYSSGPARFRPRGPRPRSKDDV